VSRFDALVRHNLVLIAQEPGPMISRITMPIVIILVLRPLYASALGGRVAGTTQAVTGMLVMFSLLGMSVVGTAVLSERILHTFDRLRATPAGPATLLAGKGVPVLLMVLLQQAVILGMGVALLGLPVKDPTLLVVAVLGWAGMLVCVGTAVATLVRSQAELSAAIDIGSMLVTCLGGAFVPLSAMPAWARHLAPASPGYWAMRGLRGALAGQAGVTWSSVAVISAVALVAAALAMVRVARGWGRTQVA
jgi:ABC-2 type transport system permease protein